MSQRSKVLQLQPDYNVKAHDFADLAEQIVKALPSDRYEVTAAFLRGKPGPVYARLYESYQNAKRTMSV